MIQRRIRTVTLHDQKPNRPFAGIVSARIGKNKRSLVNALSYVKGHESFAAALARSAMAGLR
jgi:hypothetical protein